MALKGDLGKFGEPSIEELIKALDSYAETPIRDIKSPFLLPIDNALAVPGRGTVVVGTLQKGIIRKNDEAEVLGHDLKIKTSVSDIQIFRQSVLSGSYS